MTGSFSGIDLDPVPIAVTIAAASKPANATTQTSAAFTFSTNDAVASVRCRLDGAPFSLCTSPTSQTFASLAPDSHTFVVQATDAAGNTATDSYTWSISVFRSATAPETSVLDDFNRANGGAGTNWSLIRPSGFAPMNVSGNAAVDSSTGGFAWNYWNAANFGPDSEAYVTVATYGASDMIRIGARVTGGTNAHSGYYASINSSGTWSIIRIDNGSSSPVTLASVTRPISSGDKIGIRIVGSVVTALHYSAAAGWVGSSATTQARTPSATPQPVAWPSSSRPARSTTSAAAPFLRTTPPANGSPPTISGSLVDGQTLTASPGSWTGSPAPTFTYQWQRCDSSGANCNPILGASSSTYTLVTADVGSTIVVAVTGSNAPARPAPSPRTRPLSCSRPTSPPSNSSPPTISGSLVDGQTLTASPGSWTGIPAPTFTYQWQRCDNSGANCNPILGASSSTYTLVTADVGSTIVVAVTGSNSSGTAGPVSSNATAVVQPATSPPSNSSPPTISGSTGRRANIDRLAGQLDRLPAPTFTYQWQRCDNSGANCNPILGAASSTYTLVTADVGSTIVVAVTGSNAPARPAPSPRTRPLSCSRPRAHRRTAQPPTISGSLVDGQTLTASPGSWTGNPAPTFTYQWQRCDTSGANCNPILGASSSTYTLVTADVGSTIVVAVTGSNAPARPAPSPRTRPLSCSRPRAHRRTARRRRSAARLVDGQTADRVAGHLDRHRRHRRSPISGSAATPAASTAHRDRRRATTTYTLVTADVGYTIVVAVTGTNSAGSGRAPSPPTRPRRAAGRDTPPVNTAAADDHRHGRSDGQQLTASPGTWTGIAGTDVHVSVAALRHGGANCNPILGASSLDLHPRHRRRRLDDRGRSHRHQQLRHGRPRLLDATAVVQPATSPPANTRRRRSAARRSTGNTLTASPGTWTGSPAPTFTYQWQRCDSSGANCNPILGASSSTYTLVTADVGSTIVVAVTGTNSSGRPAPSPRTRPPSSRARSHQRPRCWMPSIAQTVEQARTGRSFGQPVLRP